MPNTYDAPNPKQQDPKPPGAGETVRKSVGVYDRPKSAGPSRTFLVVLAIVAALVLVIFLVRYARGAAPSAAPGDEPASRPAVQKFHAERKIPLAKDRPLM